jgi:hypothetical protein
MTTAGVKVSEVLDAARRGRAMLAPEIAGYLILAAADQLSRSPTQLDEYHCGLLVEGGRVVLAPSPPATAIESERALRELLRRLLDAANGRAPALSAVANASAKGDVAGLIAELESALIPVNRSAAGRALSRLARDAVRARTDAPPAPETPSDDVDDTERIEVGAGEPPARESADYIEDDELVPVDASPAPPPYAAPPSVDRGRASATDVDDLLDARLSSTPPPPVVPSPRTPPPPVAASAPSSPLPPPVLPPPRTPPPPPVTAAAPTPLPPPPSPVTAPKNDVARPSYPSQSSRGVDELLENFMSTTSRKEERVAQDLRSMTGVDGGGRAASAPPPATPGYESPFHNAAGTADFYTTTPPPRGMIAQSVAPAPDDDPLARRSTRRKVYVMFALLALLTLGAVTLFRLEPGFLSGRTADVVDAEKRAAAAAAASIAARAAAGVCRATVVVTDVPTGAEVLVRSGVAPVDVDRVPSGARLEFVALVDGYAPRRSVIPQGVEWESGAGKPRYELPIQLEKSRVKGGALDPWPQAEPGSVVGGQGAPGTVHVVTSPRGAEVWMVAGGAPEAKLESLPCGVGIEILVAGVAQGQPFRRRLRVDAAELKPEPSANVATARVSAK